MRIVVAGGHGMLGRHVVTAVRASGHDAVALSRRSGVDLLSGAGIVPALRGADAVIDASSPSGTTARASLGFFPVVTRNLRAAESEAGVPHHVAISIIGAAEINASYYAGKAAQESILMAEKHGWSLLRTSQFHEFVLQLIDGGKVGPLQMVPKMRSQPIAVAEVAAALAEIACHPPRGLAVDLAGPREERMADLTRRYLAATGVRRPVVELSIPGAWGRGMRSGILLPPEGSALGAQTFEEWLSAVGER